MSTQITALSDQHSNDQHLKIKSLEPTSLWKHFVDLNAVPRPSKQEERVIRFAQQFGESLNLETIIDAVGNVIIRKPASPGMENRTPIVMQSHLDMVHQKNSDIDFDFDQQGIEMLLDDDWVKANGTTLGADNGIGVATIMAVLSSDDIAHPAIEALFTIDEETGMTGAKGLVGGLLNGKILLNLDTEDDNELTIGCAGGVDITATHKYLAEDTPAGSAGFKIAITGLSGGHSGMQIHEGLANANKIMNRILWKASSEFELHLVEIDGGGLRNAIPRESFATIVVNADQSDEFQAWLDSYSEMILLEYKTTDPDGKISYELMEHPPEKIIPPKLQKYLLGTIYGVHSGIHRMSPDIRDLVQTSNNLARVLVKDGEIQIGCLTRSSVNTERDDLANAISAVLSLSGGQVETSGDYPGWKPSPQSTIVKLMAEIYEEMFDEKPHVAACHAGLECGIIGTNYPEMEMISFGPNIRGAHSPDERVQISSVQKFWKYLLETLKRIP
ncbi:MAG: aminoacyl-histidine dipeptidase [Planctomycetota bacterium]